MTKQKEFEIDPEILAANLLYQTLDALTQDERNRIFKLAKDRYNLEV